MSRVVDKYKVTFMLEVEHEEGGKTSHVEDALRVDLELIASKSTPNRAHRIKYVSAGQVSAQAKGVNTTGMGEVQWSVLRSLIQHTRWSLHCGWLWDTHMRTLQIMESLVKRGMATKHVLYAEAAERGQKPRVPPKFEYRPSDAGRREVERHRVDSSRAATH